MFLQGPALTLKMQHLVASKGPMKIAIAYWGSNALNLLKPNLANADLKVVCCLKGGKSAPEVIEKFGDRARQEDRLHAKVIWTPAGAVVGSANASSNGLPAEEDGASGLLEAGVFLNGAKELDDINEWFEQLYNKSRPITKPDLKAAKIARERGFWASPVELVAIPLQLLKDVKLAVLLWATEPSAELNKQVEELRSGPIKSFERTALS